jgi:transportin-3
MRFASQEATRTLCGLQAEPLKALIERHRTNSSNVPIYKNTQSDPVLYLDRLASIFRNLTPVVTPGALHPCQEVATDLWPIISAACDTFAREERIMERCCRTLRFTVR